MENSDLIVKHEHFLTRLQQLEIASVGVTDPSTLADCYRNIYLHLSHMQGLAPETKESLKKYTFIADKMDATGLNNYADGAMALCSYHKNESMKWQSSLCSTSFLSGLQIATNEECTGDDVILTLPSLRSTNACSSSDQASLKLSAGNALFSTGLNQCRGSNGSNTAQSVGYGGFRSVDDKPVEPPMTNSTNQTGSYNRNAGWQLPAVSDTTNSAFFPGNNTEGPYANFGQKRKASNSLYKHQKVAGGSRPREDLEEDEEGEVKSATCGPFKTARQQLVINQMKKGNDRSSVSESNYGAVKKSLGTRRGPAAKFIPPVLNQDTEDDAQYGKKSHAKQTRSVDGTDEDVVVDERLKGIDPKMIELINNEIMDHGTLITWSDIAGLEFAKKTIKEIVVWPMLRPDIFVGLRGPPKGLLLFGPPGTGKTLIGKCIASQSKSTFFSISASSLTSKWVGEGEKMVRALFAVARCHQPAVVFIDEIDSLLSQRSDSEHESSRRIKTEFLVQLDGASTQSEDRLLVIGATNRPHEIDEAARRRFVKRLLIPLPEPVARQQIVTNLMAQQKNNLSELDVEVIIKQTDGYSGADMTNLCREAALGPIRSISFEDMEIITPDQVRPIMYEDFEAALCQVRASVSSKDLQLYTEWNKTYGSFGH